MDPTPHAEPAAVKRILCVDDEPAIRQVLMLQLQRHGYEVETATDGLAAWHRIAREPQRFDAIITDNQMPNLSGIDLVERLHSSGFTGKIIFFSSTLSSLATTRLQRLRVTAMIEKGRPMSDLLRALESAPLS